MPTPQISALLADMYASTLTYYQATLDAKGTATLGSGTPVAAHCRPGGSTLHRLATGKEISPRVVVTTSTYHALDVTGFLYDLPSRYAPYAQQQAIDVQTVEDDNGPHHQMLYFA